ncbi:hypothetical protein BDF19DRAFT_431750 [Syncephalis fuscata]|nr:hypothetical protein BDF19DRAFT_431750 [Syncephalis fuscata]
MFKSTILAAIVAVASVVLVDAHVSITPANINADTYSTIAFRIPHGCNGSPTNKVTIKLPTNTSSVKGAYIAGWQVSVTQRALETPFVSDGKTVNSTVDTVTWTADPAGNNTLPDNAYLDFGLTLKTPIKPNDSDKLAFELYQTCVSGNTNWTDTAANSEHPAPAVKLLAKGASATSGAALKASSSWVSVSAVALLASAAYLL